MEADVTEKLYDLTELEKMVGGNTEFLASLASIYLDTVPLNSKEMMQAAASGDWLAVSKLAHKMKPTIDSMNIVSITADIRTLETKAGNKTDTDKLKNLAVKVDRVINAVAEQLKDEYNL